MADSELFNDSKHYWNFNSEEPFLTADGKRDLTKKGAENIKEMEQRVHLAQEKHRNDMGRFKNNAKHLVNTMVENNPYVIAGRKASEFGDWLTQPMHQNHNEQSWEGYGPLKEDPKFYYDGLQNDLPPGPYKENYVVDQSTVKPRWQKWFESDGFKKGMTTEEKAIAENLDPEVVSNAAENAYANEMKKSEGAAPAGVPASGEEPNNIDAMLGQQTEPTAPRLASAGIDWKPALALADSWAGRPSNLAGAYKSPMSQEERDLLQNKMDREVEIRKNAEAMQKQQNDEVMKRAMMHRDTAIESARIAAGSREKVASMRPAKIPADPNKSKNNRLDQALKKKHNVELDNIANQLGSTSERLHQQMIDRAKVEAEKNNVPLEQVYEDMVRFAQEKADEQSR